MCSISVPFSFLDWLSCTRSNIAKDRFLDIVVFIFAGSIDTSISAMQHVAMFSIVCNQIQDVQQTERAVCIRRNIVVRFSPNLWIPLL